MSVNFEAKQTNICNQSLLWGCIDSLLQSYKSGTIIKQLARDPIKSAS